MPNLFAVIGMILIARNSDRNRERRWHVAIPALFGALGLLFSAVWSGNTALAIVALWANIGICTVPLFWCRPRCWRHRRRGIALINSVGNLAGFVSPYLVGWLGHDRHHQHRPVHAGRLPVVGALVALAQPAKLVNK